MWVKSLHACLPPFQMEGQFCFLLGRDRLMWEAASSNCSAFEGDVILAELNNQDVNPFSFVHFPVLFGCCGNLKNQRCICDSKFCRKWMQLNP